MSKLMPFGINDPLDLDARIARQAVIDEAKGRQRERLASQVAALAARLADEGEDVTALRLTLLTVDRRPRREECEGHHDDDAALLANAGPDGLRCNGACIQVIDRIERRYVEDDEPFCRKCGDANDDGEGYDGLCGPCADRAEAQGVYGS